MVRPYFVRFASRSALRLNGRRRFKGPAFRAVVTDALKGLAQPSPPQHVGLLFTIELDAENSLVAICRSLSIAERICDALSVTHATAIGDPQLLFALETTVGSRDRELAQAIRNAPELPKVRREFSDGLFRPLHDLLESVRIAELSAEAPQPIVPRVDRALHHLRRSYVETDLLDRFEDLTAGLQSIDPRVRQKFGGATTSQPPCKSCGARLHCKACGEAAAIADNWAGIDYIVTEVLEHSKEEARRLRKRRNDIAHALKEIPELIEGMEELSSLAHMALIAGILLLIEAPESYVQSLLRSPLALFTAPEFLVTVTLRNFPIERINERRIYPLLKLNYVELASPVSVAEPRCMGDLIAVALNMEAANFTEDWEPGRVYRSMRRDPEDLSPDPHIFIQKIRLPQPESPESEK